MQTTIPTLILSLLFFQSAGPGKKSDRQMDELNGAVRFVRVDTEDLRDHSDSSKSNARFLQEIVTYDESGRMTEQILGTGTDCASSRHVFSYDPPGNRTEAVYWGKALIAGDRSEGSQESASSVVYKHVFKLNKAGERSELEQYDNKGSLLGKTLYEYDDKGRVKKIVQENKSTRSRCELTYNDKGLPEEKSCQYPDFRSRDRSQYAYEFDANDNWIKKTSKTSTVAPDGSEHETTRVSYREIQYYPAKEDQTQKAVPDRFDVRKLATCAPMIIRKSGGALQGSATKRVEPRYPQEAKAARIGGSVVVEVTLDEGGRVIAARSISGPAELRAASVEAARGWEFRPTSLSGVPVKVIGTITFNFNL